MYSTASIADTADYDSSRTLKDKRRTEEEWIIYQGLPHSLRILTFLVSMCCRVFTFLFSDFAFINNQVLLGYNDTISWDNIASLKLNDITNYKIIDADGLSHEFFSTDNWNFLFFKPFLKVDKTFVHCIVIVATKGDQDDYANENRETLCPSKVTIFANETCEHRDCTTDEETEVELISFDFIYNGLFQLN